MSIVKKTDYTTEAQDDLVSPVPFGNATALTGVLAAITDRIQEIEDDAYAIVEQLDIDTAEGAQLDLIGKRVGQPRWDRSDADYRTLIQARIKANATHGTVDPILEVVQSLVGEGPVYYQSGAAASFLLWVNVPELVADDVLAAVRFFLDIMAPTGVQWEIFEFPDGPDDPPFQFDTALAGMDLGLMTARATVG